jgi:hypothetical protein
MEKPIKFLNDVFALSPKHIVVNYYKGFSDLPGCFRPNWAVISNYLA